MVSVMTLSLIIVTHLRASDAPLIAGHEYAVTARPRMRASGLMRRRASAQKARRLIYTGWRAMIGEAAPYTVSGVRQQELRGFPDAICDSPRHVNSRHGNPGWLPPF